MLPEFFNDLAVKIHSLKLFQATLRLITLVVHHALLSSLLYLPLCMQARAEGFIQDANFLEEEYRVFWPSNNDVELRRRPDTGQIQVSWLNDIGPNQRRTLEKLATGWKKHVEDCQLRWAKMLGCFIAIGIALIAFNGPEQNRILVCLVVVRGAFATLHLVAFHIVVYSRVKELDSLMKSLPSINSPSSPLWLSLSLPLASILWFMTSALIFAIMFVLKILSILPGGHPFGPTTSAIFICIIPDVISVPWIYYQFRQLG